MERLALITATDVCLKLSDSHGADAVIEFVQLLNSLESKGEILSLSQLIMHEMKLVGATALRPQVETILKKCTIDAEWFGDLFVEECNLLLKNVVLL